MHDFSAMEYPSCCAFYLCHLLWLLTLPPLWTSRLFSSKHTLIQRVWLTCRLILSLLKLKLMYFPLQVSKLIQFWLFLGKYSLIFDVHHQQQRQFCRLFPEQAELQHHPVLSRPSSSSPFLSWKPPTQMAHRWSLIPYQHFVSSPTSWHPKTSVLHPVAHVLSLLSQEIWEKLHTGCLVTGYPWQE